MRDAFQLWLSFSLEICSCSTKVVPNTFFFFKKKQQRERKLQSSRSAIASQAGIKQRSGD